MFVVNSNYNWQFIYLFGLKCWYFVDEDLLTDPCMAYLKNKSKKMRRSVDRLKRARSRMKVFVIEL